MFNRNDREIRDAFYFGVVVGIGIGGFAVLVGITLGGGAV